MLVLLQLITLTYQAEAVQHKYTAGYIRGTPVKLRVVEVGGYDNDGRPLMLEQRAADSFIKMRAAMVADGLNLQVNYAHRSMKQQTSLFRKNHKLASRPGTSPHQKGIAIDVANCTKYISNRRVDTRTCRWLRRHAKQYGFSRTIKSEPWHWQYIY
jgi:LAS superfamily LD-carboxypeptidase LdcB